MAGQFIMEKVQRLVITGASGSVGSQTTLRMVQQGYSVIMACRNLAKGESIRQSILDQFPNAQIEVRRLNLEKLESVVEFVNGLKEDNIEVIKLFNNAGVINRDYGLSANGFEKTLAVNYLGPALLSMMLAPDMPADGEIVNMVSLTCALTSIHKDLFELKEKEFSQLGTYSKTKLALLLFSIELSKHIKQRVNVSDPGIVNSNMLTMGYWYDSIADIIFRPFTASPKKGARSAINALNSTDARLQYFKGNKFKPIKKNYITHPLSEWLWTETIAQLKAKGFPVRL